VTETQYWDPFRPLGQGTVLLDRYRLHQLLGRGGMGDVYLAQDVVLNRQVAVKVFRSGTTSAGDAKRQQLEAELLARLSHPGLVTVFDAGFDAEEQLSFLVMEVVEGPTLADRLADGPLLEGRVRQVGAAVADALAYVHGRGVVHRDVKPGNVLFTDAEDYTRVKISDFGIARLADSARLTGDGLIVGSARYLSPEQARGEDVGPPADIYALGLVLLECLTGAPAFPGAGIEPVVARLHRNPQIPDGVDPALGRLLTVMTSRDPAERPTAHHVAAALGGAPISRPLPLAPVVAVSDPSDTTAPLGIETVEKDRDDKGHRWAWIAAACIAVLVALAWSVVVLERTPDADAGTVGGPSTASPEATESTPTSPTTATATQNEPTVLPARPSGDRTEADNGNGNGKGKSKGKGGKNKGD
jgi:eukaryotic-like serine/threonine-protein kinase